MMNDLSTDLWSAIAERETDKYSAVYLYYFPVLFRQAYGIVKSTVKAEQIVKFAMENSLQKKTFHNSFGLQNKNFKKFYYLWR